MMKLMLGAIAATLIATPEVPGSSMKGPPWISIEYPVNPYDQTTRDAYLVVHAYHHGTPTSFPVSGTAEGIVGGQRKSVPLTFERTSRPAVFALKKQWPAEGAWTLVIAVNQGTGDGVSAVVDIASSGDVAKVTVPTRKQNGHTVPAAVDMAGIEVGLKQRFK